MTRKLNISADLAIPPEIVTSTTIIYGGKGMGKTNLGSVIVEELAKAGLRWSVLDPMGVFWGLRHSADGKGPGIECVILGGTHGDIPIEPTGGATVADLVIDESANTIIDFSRKQNGQMWSKGEKIRFVTEYANRLFERQGELVNGHRREPLLQILDEAARYIPQTIPASSPMLAESVGAWEQIAEEGRNIGLGIGFLTQRSARMNKSVSELADVMFAFRTVGPNSVRAIVDWLGEHIEKERVREVAGKVRELDVGQALIVSPGWLRVEKIAQIRPRQTFDSSATPKPGEQRRRVTGPAAKPDLEKYRARMLESIEKAKENDPRELKKKIGELTGRIRQLEKAPAPKAVAANAIPDTRALERAVKTATAPLRRALEAAMKFIINVSTQNFDVAGVDKAELERAVGAAIARATALVDQRLEARTKQLEILRASAQKIVLALKTTLTDDTPVEINVAVQKNEAFTVTEPRARTPAPPRVTDGSISGAKQKILDAVATLEELGVERPTLIQVALFVGVSHTTGSYQQNVRELADAAYLERGNGQVALTALGKTVARADVDRDPIEFWKYKLPGAQAKLFSLIIEHAPISREDLAAKAGVSHTTGSYQQNLRDMRTYGVIEIDGGVIRLSDLLSAVGV